jgi:hypothetical protein
MAGPIDHTAPKKERFLQAYALVGVITAAAGEAGCNPRAHYNWMKEDPEYPARFAAAKEEAADRLDAEIVRRAVTGYEEPVFGTIYNEAGKPLRKDVVGHIRRYSDVLLMFRAKALRPEMYRERFDYNVKTEDVTDDGQRTQYLERCLARLGGLERSGQPGDQATDGNGKPRLGGNGEGGAE